MNKKYLFFRTFFRVTPTIATDVRSNYPSSTRICDMDATWQLDHLRRLCSTHFKFFHWLRLCFFHVEVDRSGLASVAKTKMV